jgi:thymidylate synthase ThyX
VTLYYCAFDGKILLVRQSGTNQTFDAQWIQEIEMSVTELLQTVQFLVDNDGNKKAAVLDYAVWEELLTLLEDIEDDEEIQRLREAEEETLLWEQAKAELRDEGVDV